MFVGANHAIAVGVGDGVPVAVRLAVAVLELDDDNDSLLLGVADLHVLASSALELATWMLLATSLITSAVQVPPTRWAHSLRRRCRLACLQPPRMVHA